MFIRRKKYEEALEKARMEGYEDAMKLRYEEDRFTRIHERIDRLAEMIERPKTVSGFSNEVVTPRA